MRYQRILIAILASVILFGAFSSVHAISDVLSQSQIDAVQTSCQSIQSNLQRLQQSDRLLRGNLGQNYDAIAQHLMAPLNSRIALNGLNGVDLTQTTVDFNNAFTTFRNDYMTYDDDLQAALAVDCNKNPVQQYSAIQTAKQSRKTVANDATALNGLLETYQKQVKAFASDQLKTTESQ